LVFAERLSSSSDSEARRLAAQMRRHLRLEIELAVDLDEREDVALDFYTHADAAEHAGRLVGRRARRLGRDRRDRHRGGSGPGGPCDLGAELDGRDGRDDGLDDNDAVALIVAAASGERVFVAVRIRSGTERVRTGRQLGQDGLGNPDAPPCELGVGRLPRALLPAGVPVQLERRRRGEAKHPGLQRRWTAL
jgi:hypothetical protein